MKIRQVKPAEAPRHLLEQKEWNLEIFYGFAVQDPEDWHCFVVSQGDDDIAMMLFIEDPLHDDLACNTLVIDKAHRDPKTTTAVLLLLRRLMHSICREKGLSYITGSFPEGPTHMKPKALQRVFARDGWRGYVLETVLREKVET